MEFAEIYKYIIMETIQVPYIYNGNCLTIWPACIIGRDEDFSQICVGS